MRETNPFKPVTGSPYPSMHIDLIRGLLIATGGGEPRGVRVQFDSDGQRLEMTIPLAEAMTLLGCLKEVQHRHNLTIPNDPDLK